MEYTTQVKLDTDMSSETYLNLQTVTADFPEGVVVRGASRVVSDEDVNDENRNESTRLVTWIWVIVRPTPLRTSVAYSEVSSSST